MSRLPFENVEPATGPAGQKAHPGHIEQSARLEQRLYRVTDKVWSLVGNGLSNQSFIEGPDGLICIDTGECVEEMRAALAEIRRHTSAPVIACIYTHFHYVNGTTALLEECEGDLPIYGHNDIEANLARYGGETGPRITRGMVHQFAVAMPVEGPDGLVNVGLGRFFRNPEHSPYTLGHLPVTHGFDDELITTIAGLEVHLCHAPSDADDSITIWFPGLGVCINNLVWPALFNVFAIRGEIYRDPRVVMAGVDHIVDLGPDHLLATHGPPISGRDEIRAAATDFRDAIQCLWDQTVRGANKGLALDELTRFVQLPERFERSYFTRQYYGVAEHHVKQIYHGLFGWFDEDDNKLFPLAPAERAEKIVEGFGGVEPVRRQVDAATAAEEYRWALELGSYLVRVSDEAEDRNRLADVMRRIGQRTMSANVRNWCLTRALELEGKIDLSRFREHRFRAEVVQARPAVESVPMLRVLLAPERTTGMDFEVRFEFDDGSTTGLRIRDGVAVPTDGKDAGASINLSANDWANVVGGKLRLTKALADGMARTTGDEAGLKAFFAAFDHPSF